MQKSIILSLFTLLLLGFIASCKKENSFPVNDQANLSLSTENVYPIGTIAPEGSEVSDRDGGCCTVAYVNDGFPANVWFSARKENKFSRFRWSVIFTATNTVVATGVTSTQFPNCTPILWHFPINEHFCQNNISATGNYRILFESQSLNAFGTYSTCASALSPIFFFNTPCE